MITTLNQIREHDPCSDGWKKLLKHLNKTQADDAPLHLRTVLSSNGLGDALWCLRAIKGHDREMRLYAVWCAKQVKHLMQDQRSLNALEVAERYAEGLASDEELKDARCAAWADAWADAWAAAGAARDAAGDAARTAAGAARDAAAWAAARGALGAAAWAATAWAAAWAAQEIEFKRLLDCIDNNIKYEI